MDHWWPATGSGTLSVVMLAWDLLKEVAVIFIKLVNILKNENS